jgi:hypothetical protein
VCDNLGRDKDRKVSELLGNDVLEAPDKTVNILDAQKATWSYGTIGFGVDLARTVWPEQEFLFSSQQKPVIETQGHQKYFIPAPSRLPDDRWM